MVFLLHDVAVSRTAVVSFSVVAAWRHLLSSLSQDRPFTMCTGCHVSGPCFCVPNLGMHNFCVLQSTRTPGCPLWNQFSKGRQRLAVSTWLRQLQFFLAHTLTQTALCVCFLETSRELTGRLVTLCNLSFAVAFANCVGTW